MAASPLSHQTLTCGRLFPSGCKVESVFLNIEAVNTHRERPEVNKAAVCLYGEMHVTARLSEVINVLRQTDSERTCFFQNVDVDRDPAEALETVPEHI